MDPMELKKQMDAAIAAGRPEAVLSMVRGMQDKQFESDILSTKIGLGVGAVLMTLFGAVLAYVGLSSLLGETGAPGVPTLLAALALLGLAGWFAFMIASLAPPPRELERTGMPATATIEDYRSALGSFSVGSKGSQRSVARVAIDLAVTPREGAPYRITVKQHLPGHDLVALTVGETVDAFVDRASPSRILLLLGRKRG